jgi:hypothetical protein
MLQLTPWIRVAEKLVKKIPHLLWSPKVYYCVHNSQMNPINTFPNCWLSFSGHKPAPSSSLLPSPPTCDFLSSCYWCFSPCSWYPSCPPPPLARFLTLFLCIIIIIIPLSPLVPPRFHMVQPTPTFPQFLMCGSFITRNVTLLEWDYTALYPRKLSSEHT